MGAALILCRVARACARRSMPPDMTSAEFCSAHGDTFVAWLRDNTQECKCDEKYGNDEARQRGDVSNADRGRLPAATATEGVFIIIITVTLTPKGGLYGQREVTGRRGYRPHCRWP